MVSKAVLAAVGRLSQAISGSSPPTVEVRPHEWSKGCEVVSLEITYYFCCLDSGVGVGVGWIDSPKCFGI